MSGPPVPQYGNFGGNSDNDAWEQADRYATFTANNYNIASLVGGPPGSGTLPNPLDYPITTIVHVTRRADNVAFVKSMLADIDRKPINDVDTAYLNHDLGFVPDSAITNIINNNQMGASVWQALVSGGAGLDPYGYLYGPVSVPFIVGPGSVYNVLTEVKNQTPPPTFEAETIYVTAATQRSNHIIELSVRLLSHTAGIFVDSIVNVIDDSWNYMSSALGNAYTQISTALGNAWSWFKEHLFASPSPGPNGFEAGDAGHGDASHTDSLGTNHDTKYALWGDLSGVKMEYVKVAVGDKIDMRHLSDYDDNGDGYLTLDDHIVAALGIASPTANGVTTLRAFTTADVIDVTTGRDATGQLVEVGALKEFYNAVNVGSSASTYAAAAHYLGASDGAVSLVAPPQHAPAELIAA